MAYRVTNLYTLCFLAAAAVSYGLAVVAFRHRSRRAAGPLVGLLVGAGTVSFGDALRVAAPSETHVLFWNKVAYVGFVLLPISYILFVAAFTNRERWFRRRYVLGLAAISLAALLIILTNPLHSLWRQGETFSVGTAPPVLVERRGPLWYPWVVYTYAIVVVGLYFLLGELVGNRQSRTYRVQTALVLLGVSIPSGGIALFVLGFLPFDLSPITFAVMGVAFSVAIFRYRLLDIVPIARDAVVESMDSGVLVLDAEDRVVDANPRALQVLDVEESKVPGASLAAILADRPDVLERFDGVRETSESVAVETDGGTRHYHVEVSPVRDSLETYLGRVVVFNDVTEEVQRERRLEARTDELRRRNERLDEFAAIVSHDLRNPLDIVQGYLEPARETGREEYFEEMERGIDRMEALVDDLLMLARQGEVVDDTVPVDVGVVARETWATVRTDRGDLRVAEDGLPTVEADRGRLLGVFENLFRNALEHNPGEVTVTVGGLDGDRTGFYVADDGSGIDPEDRDRVLEEGVTTDGESTGLGLAIVREVIEAHGWTLRVTDSTDGGARFEVETG